MSLLEERAPAAAQARARSGPRSTRWWTCVLALALGLSLVDDFWAVSLEGSVGAIERSQGPFLTWVTQSLLLLPVHALAVAGALALAHRRFGPVLHRTRHVVAACLLVVVAGTAVGVATVGATAVVDYRLQARLIETAHGGGHDDLSQVPASAAGRAAQAALPRQAADACDTVCAAKRRTIDVHLLSLGYAAVLLLLTNLVVVGWTVAMRGGRLDT